MASLEIQPNPESIEHGPAEQAGVFLEQNESRPPLMEIGGLVLHDTVSLLTERDPISTLQRVTKACQEFGDELKMLAEPGGSVHLFVPEEAQERFLQKEAQRIEEHIPQEIEAHSPLPPS